MLENARNSQGISNLLNSSTGERFSGRIARTSKSKGSKLKVGIARNETLGERIMSGHDYIITAIKIRLKIRNA